MASQTPSTPKALADRLDDFNTSGPYYERESKRPPPTERNQPLQAENLDRRESEVSVELLEAWNYSKRETTQQ